MQTQTPLQNLSSKIAYCDSLQSQLDNFFIEENQSFDRQLAQREKIRANQKQNQIKRIEFGNTAPLSPLSNS